MKPEIAREAGRESGAVVMSKPTQTPRHSQSITSDRSTDAMCPSEPNTAPQLAELAQQSAVATTKPKHPPRPAVRAIEQNQILPEMGGQRDARSATKPNNVPHPSEANERLDMDARRPSAKDSPKPINAAHSVAAIPPTKVGRKAAIPRPKPNIAAQPSGINGSTVRKGRRQGAIVKPEPTGSARSVASPGKGHNNPPLDVAEIAKLLKGLQKLRRKCIRFVSMTERSIESFIVSYLGVRIDDSETKLKAAYSTAHAIRLSIESGDDDADWLKDDRLREALMPFVDNVIASYESRAPWVKHRKKAEKDMIKLAKQLPVYKFVEKSVQGFGAIGLAVYVGEAGLPLGDYRTVAGLWKRLCVGMLPDGTRQRGTAAKRGTPDLEKLHYYSGKRRGEVWAFADPMFRHQVTGDKDEDGNDPVKTKKPVVVPAHPTGPYGRIYAARRAKMAHLIEETAHLDKKDPNKWTKARCLNDAKRIMTKALIKDLWIEWKKADGSYTTEGMWREDKAS